LVSDQRIGNRVTRRRHIERWSFSQLQHQPLDLYKRQIAFDQGLKEYASWMGCRGYGRLTQPACARANSGRTQGKNRLETARQKQTYDPTKHG
jgi:hypothetical protein